MPDRLHLMLLATADPHPCVAFLPCPPHRASAPAPFLPASPYNHRRSPAQARLDLGLLQREVAEQLGVTESTVTSWELNRSTPAIRFLPQLIRFLGFFPFPSGGSFGEHLKAARRSLGLSQKRLAGVLDVDESTVALWEHGHRHPSEQLVERLKAFLAAGSLLQVDAKAVRAQVLNPPAFP
jgi:transcriptional regulator with XRE-family HTH domain